MSVLTSLVESTTWTKCARSLLSYKVPKHAQATKVPRTYGQKPLDQGSIFYDQAEVPEMSVTAFVTKRRKD